jgi:phenylacetate-CoA ligase
MENFDSLVTRPGLRLADVENYLATLRGNELFQGKYFVSATAGTTGRRGIFLWNFREWVQVVASYNRAFDWAGSTAGLTHRVKTAVVSSTNPSHQSARVGALFTVVECPRFESIPVMISTASSPDSTTGSRRC